MESASTWSGAAACCVEPPSGMNFSTQLKLALLMADVFGLLWWEFTEMFVCFTSLERMDCREAWEEKRIELFVLSGDKVMKLLEMYSSGKFPCLGLVSQTSRLIYFSYFI